MSEGVDIQRTQIWDIRPEASCMCSLERTKIVGVQGKQLDFVLDFVSADLRPYDRIDGDGFIKLLQHLYLPQ